MSKETEKYPKLKFTYHVYDKITIDIFRIKEENKIKDTFKIELEGILTEFKDTDQRFSRLTCLWLIYKYDYDDFDDYFGNYRDRYFMEGDVLENHEGYYGVVTFKDGKIGIIGPDEFSISEDLILKETYYCNVGNLLVERELHEYLTISTYNQCKQYFYTEKGIYLNR